MAKPEVLYSVGFGRTERRIRFQPKQPPFSETTKQSGTGGIATLGDHNSTPLLLFKSAVGKHCSMRPVSTYQCLLATEGIGLGKFTSGQGRT